MGFGCVNDVDVDIGTVNITSVLSITGGSLRISEQLPGTQHILGDVEVGTVPVTGAFYQGTQPVSGAVEVGTVPVTGDFFPGTQSIAGSVGIIEPIDGKTGGVTTIEVPHHEVHEGEMFESDHIFQDVANNANADFLIQNSGIYELHTTFHIVTGGEAFAYLYEGPTISSNGTAAYINDMNRETSNIPTALTYYGPTVASNGTQLVSSLIEGGDAGRAIGGQIRSNSEWILKKSQKYLIRVTNKAGVAKHISIAAEFYEVS